MRRTLRGIVLLSLGLFACDETIDPTDADTKMRTEPVVRPAIASVSPTNGSLVDTESMELSFAVGQAAAVGYKASLAGKLIKEEAAAIPKGETVKLPLKLAMGPNVVRVELLDGQGVADAVELVYVLKEDAIPDAPVVVLKPLEADAEQAPTVKLAGTIRSSAAVTAGWKVGARIGDIELTGEAPRWAFEVEVPLALGKNLIVIEAKNAGGTDQAELTLSRAGDTLAPQLAISFPWAGHTSQTLNPQVRGTVSDDDDLDEVWVMIGDRRVDVEVADGHFAAQIPLNGRGLTRFTVHALDASGNEATADSSFYFGRRIAAAGAHTAMIRADGAALVWGRNNQGQAGMGVTTDLEDDNHPSAPIRVNTREIGTSTTVGALSFTVTSTAISSISLNSNSTQLLDADGHVWAFGDNRRGQLCLHNAPREVLTPTPVEIDGVVAAEVGARFSMFLKADGQVYVCGQSRAGVVPDGAEYTPVVVPGLQDIVQIVAGSDTAFAVDRAGRVFAWGSNGYAQLGQGATDEDAHPTPTQISVLAPVVSVGASGRHVLALTRGNQVFGWGLNFSDQVGDIDARYVETPALLAWSKDTEVVAVDAEGNQSYMEDAEGQIFGWGMNLRGSLGIQSDRNQVAPTTPVFGVKKALGMGIGNLHAAALDAEEHVYTWGWSFEGCLGGGKGTIHRWTYRNPILITIPVD